MADPTVVMSGEARPAAWLYIRSGPGTGRDFRLSGKTTIGSDPGKCDVILDDSTVSAKHAQIKREGNAFVLHDLASTNRTFLNGRQVQRQTLNDDDEIMLGTTALVFKVTPAK